MAKIKEFFKKWIANNIGYKILAVVFAFVLWLVILNTTDTTMTRTISNIPVTIMNEEMVLDGTHVYTIESGETATIVVSGKRSIINSLGVSDFMAIADFSELSLTNAVPIKIEISGEKVRYSSSVTITQKTMSMVINLEDMKEKTYDVQVNFVGTPSESLLVEDAATVPAMVTLRAPESVIESVTNVQAVLDYATITGDGIYEVVPILLDYSGKPVEQNADIYLDYKTVGVNVVTKAIKNVPVTIAPIGVPDPSATYNGVSYSKSGITIKGNPEAVEAFTVLELPSQLLNIEGAKEDVTVSVDVTQYLPEGISVTGDTTSLTITASITPGKSTEEETEAETETETVTEAEITY
ncbi:MAG: hypothetical protein MJ086_06175 [Lachnospiraceae bacterium]|nr:hypothetical protein [Lachnospiraceae bacterium]